MRSTWIGAGIAAALVALACGGSDPEADLERASLAVEDSRERVAKAQELVQARENEFRIAQEQLAAARSVLLEANNELAQREAAVDRSATDSLIFRAVQKRLLEDEDLADVAIAARVEKGIVTLSGRVPSAKLAERAVAIARQAPGVGDVDSRIEVQAPAAKKAD